MRQALHYLVLNLKKKRVKMFRKILKAKGDRFLRYVEKKQSNFQ